jgi:OOP family OmpA-OmpF porin
MRTPHAFASIATGTLAGFPSLPAIILASSLFLLLSSIARSAQAQGIALSRFEPSDRGSRFFVADSLELHAATASPSSPQVSRLPTIAAGITSSYAHRSRTFGDGRDDPAKTGDTERSRLVQDALYIHPGASVVVSPGARFALDLPIAAAQSGESTNLAGRYYLSPQSPRFGDLRASFDLRLFGPSSRDSDGVAIAAGVRGWIPTGSPDDFTGEEAARFGSHASAAARFGFVLATARVGYMYRRDGLVGGSQIGSEMISTIGIAYVDKDWTIGPELYGATLIDRFFKTKNTPIEVLAGARRRLGSFRVGAGLGTSLVSGLGAAHLRALLSIEWAPPDATLTEDRDRDGVPDSDDVCPDVPGPKDASGCPPAPRDLDGDGIVDTEDACVDAPGPRTRDPKTHGCPIAEPPPSPPSPDPQPEPEQRDPN